MENFSDGHDPGASPTRSLIISVFRDVWEDFYDWEHEHCSILIHSNFAKRPSQNFMNKDSPVNMSRPPAQSSSRTWEGNGFEHQMWSDSYEVTVFSADGRETKTTLQETVLYPTTSAESARPYPRYEFCTPSERSQVVGDDPQAMKFFPLVDNANFDYKKYADAHDSFSWQGRRDDADCECFRKL